MKILLLEDDESLRNILKLEFEDYGFETIAIKSLDEFLNIKVDYALLDLKVEGENGLELIEKILNQNSKCKIVIYTGYGSIASAVEAVKLGAINYLSKPASFYEILKAFSLSEKNCSLVNESLEEKVFSRPSLSLHEYEYIHFVLNENKGNISKTAKELGLHRQSLQRKLKKLP